MYVKIFNRQLGLLEGATIQEAKNMNLPGHTDGWRFDFGRLVNQIKDAKCFVLVSDTSPGVIQGCMIFEMRNAEIPYMAYMEETPHNKNNQGVGYDFVTGCLIAYAFYLSLYYGKGDNMGFLFFEVMEKTAVEQKNTIELYTDQFYASLLSETIMCIHDNGGHKLIDEFLRRK